MDGGAAIDFEQERVMRVPMLLRPAMIDHDGPIPLADQVRDLLKVRILSGKLKPGTRLPSESELINMLGVSRVTVRRAIALLNNARLTESVNGKGTFVTIPTLSPRLGPPGVMHQMRELGHEATGALLWSRVEPASAEVANELQVHAGTRVMHLRLSRHVDGHPLGVVSMYAEIDLGRKMVAASIKDRDLSDVLTSDLGVRIERSNVVANALGADRESASQLGCKVGTPLLHVGVTLLDFDLRPVVFADTLFVGKLMRYRVTARR